MFETNTCVPVCMNVQYMHKCIKPIYETISQKKAFKTRHNYNSNIVTCFVGKFYHAQFPSGFEKTQESAAAPYIFPAKISKKETVFVSLAFSRLIALRAAPGNDFDGMSPGTADWGSCAQEAVKGAKKRWFG